MKREVKRGEVKSEGEERRSEGGEVRSGGEEER